MADNNRQQNQRKNVTGSYPGVTGAYKPVSAYKPSGSFTTPPPEDINARSKAVLNNTPSKPEPKKRVEPKIQSEPEVETASTTEKQPFSFKLWFSKDNVRGFLRQIRFYGIILIISVLLTWGIVISANDIFAFVKEDKSISVTLEQGQSVKSISKTLEKEGVIDHPAVFQFYCKLKKAGGRFQFGNYSLNSNMGYDQIISALSKTSVQAATFKVTIAPGSTQDEIVEYLTGNKYVTATDLEAALNDYEFKEFEFVKNLPDRRCRLEGYLPAGEYEFYEGESAVSMVSKMLARFEETILTDENKALIKASGMSLDDIVTIASLLQKECGSADMYKKASAVMRNRLNSETDNFLKLTCSINYVLPSPKSKLSTDDKKTESTYNTYLYSGLPDGPVCNPTAKAITAAISPDESDNLYFISDGKKAYYAKTADEHKANLKKASDTAKGTDTIK